MRRDIQKLKGPQVAVLVKALASLKFSDRELYDAASLRLQFTMQDINLSHVSGQGGGDARHRHAACEGGGGGRQDISLSHVRGACVAQPGCTLWRHAWVVTRGFRGV